MSRFAKWTVRGLIAVILLAAFLIFVVIPPRLDAAHNRVEPHQPYAVSDKAAALHAGMPVADLHADTLLWKRDPVKRHRRGQTDLPRFREGGVALQVFTAVTKTPSGQNYHENDSGSDDITLLAIAQGWPRRTWRSLEERARFQAQRLHHAAERDGDLTVVRSREDLAAALARRESNGTHLAALLGTEGSHALEGEITAVGRLFEEGYRVMALHHFFDNALGGSLHGVSGSGLSEFGRAAVEEMDRLGIVIDVAHSSEKVVADVLAMTQRPVILSHTGFRGACDSERNVSDATMKAIADAGGLIGVGFWPGAICDASPAGIAAAIAYGIEHFGEDAIALGSDFDGSVVTTLDASELPAVTQALLDRGLSEAQIRKVMGGNQIRFFLENLPSEETPA